MEINWHLFKKRKNLSHLSESQKWQRFLFEKNMTPSGSFGYSSGGAGITTKPSSSNETVQNWIDKIESEGYAYPTQARVDIYTEAFDYAEAEGLLSQIDLLGLTKAENTDICKIPFIHSGGADKRFTFVGNPLFSETRGLSSANGFYINTNWRAPINGINYLDGNASIGVYCDEILSSTQTLMADTGLNGIYPVTSAIQARGDAIDVFIQYDSDGPIETQDGATATGGVIAPSGIGAASLGFLSSTYYPATFPDVFIRAYRNGINITNGIEVSEIGPGTSEFSKNFLIYADNDGLDVGTQSFFGYLQMFYTGSGLLDQAKMNTFVTLLLRGTPYLRITNDAVTADYTGTDFYTYFNSTGSYNSVDESTSFNIFGERLTPDSGNITVSIPNNFEVFDGTVWQSTSFTIPYTSGSLNTGGIYKIRIKNNLSTGIYMDAVTISGGGTQTSVSIIGEVTTPSSNVLTWQNQLSGSKPSGLLIKHLNTFIDGVIADGDMNAADYFLVCIGMETDEQRLLPFKNSGGSLPTLEGATPPVGSRDEGFTGTNTGYINFNWVPSTNGVNFTQNDASIHSAYASSASTKMMAGAQDAGSIGIIRIGAGLSNMSGALNDGTYSVMTGISGASQRAYLAIIRNSNTIKFGFRNGTTGTNVSVSTNGFTSQPIYGLAYNNDGTATTIMTASTRGRFWMWGSSSISPSRVRNRFNTYLTGLGFLTD